MARFSPQLLDDIRNRLTLSEIVGRRVTYDRRKSQPQKGDFWACCPFHNEKTPSFHVDDRKGIYHCFGCGVTGDHFRFLTEKDGLSFPEAVEQLASEANVALPVFSPQAQEREQKRASLYDVVALAQQYFLSKLQAPEGALARGYLVQRGLSLETQQRFGIGYAPKERAGLKNFLAGKGVEQAQMLEAGLIVGGADIPVTYDKFRDRIMFPILDMKERPIAFGGRAMSKDNPAKYMNSPETPLFSKRSILYNGARARKVAYDKKRLIVVEGYMDVIALSQVGIDEVVAPLGTALTDEQMQLLWKMADEPVLCFDGDEAGLRAANRAVEVALPLIQAGKSQSFAFLPKGKDPDDMVRDEGASVFEEILEDKLALHKFAVIRHFDGTDFETPERKAALEKKIYDDIDQIQDKTIAYHYRQSARLDILALFSSGDQRFKSNDFGTKVQKLRVSIQSKTLDKILLGFLVEYPWLCEEFDEELGRIELGSPAYIHFINAIRQLVVDDGVCDVFELYDGLSEAFHAVLHAVHGNPERAMKEGGDVKRYAQNRGYFLKMLFPALLYDPSDDLIHQTMVLQFQKLFLRALKDEIDEAGKAGDAELAAARVEEYYRMEADILNLEEALDKEYEKLRANKNIALVA